MARYAAQLTNAGIEAARLEAQILVAEALGRNRTWVLANGEELVVDDAGRDLVQRRLHGEPLAYILGRREFYGRQYLVGPGVLIPRHETETLIESVLLRFDEHSIRVVDVGTGSGILAITLKLERPAWQVTAVDISNRALGIAKRNAKTLHAEIDFHLGDLLGPVTNQDFDLLVSNPPYVSRADSLPKEISDHEPHEALYADDDGLAIYKRIAQEARHIAHAVLEIGQTQAEAVKEIFENEGWRAVQLHQDLDGNDRVWEFARLTSSAADSPTR